MREIFKDKSLLALGKSEFNKLKKAGFLWEFYPDAPEFYEELIKEKA